MTTLVTRDPMSLLQNFGRLFEDSYFRPGLGLESFELEEGTLPLDISQTEKEMVVRASLPGYKREDVDVQVHDGILSISAGYEAGSEEQGERYYRRERRMGSVSRRVALPGIVAETETHAELKDGVLTVRIPLTEKAKPFKIAIQ
ncbi:MAG: Hsp20/alpha crystallin family protein [Candidatus Tectomicrobia bacterium]|nr:Hsp20/alpha crystallin family protein [Candidatus Tectomicrobia bacterium]